MTVVHTGSGAIDTKVCAVVTLATDAAPPRIEAVMTWQDCAVGSAAKRRRTPASVGASPNAYLMPQAIKGTTMSRSTTATEISLNAI